MKKYLYRTASGYKFQCREVEPVKLEDTYLGVYFCLLITTEVSLEKIRSILDEELMEADFEYKIPAFELLKRRDFIW